MNYPHMNNPSVSTPLCEGQTPAKRRAKGTRCGFSFAEVMFAVVILGIGFIMVAAVFPVAIQQTQTNGEENIAASVARQAAAAIASMPMTYRNPIYPTAAPFYAAPDPRSVQNLLTFPPTVKNYVKGTDATAPDAPGIMVPLIGARWNFTKTISILPTDPRYAYAAFYKRDNGSSIAQLVVVAMAVRNRATYVPGKDELSPQQQASSATVTVTLTKGDFQNYMSAATPTVPPMPNVPQTTVCPDTLAMSAGLEGYSVQIPYPSIPPQVVSPNPIGRAYSLGRVASNAGGLYTFELMGGDGLELTTGSNGKWGAYDAIFDVNSTSTTPPPPPGLVGYVNSPATMQPTVAYARLTVPTDGSAPLGRIQLNTSPIPGDPVPAAAVTGAFVIIADDFPIVTGLTASGGNGLAPPQDYNLPDSVPATASTPAYSVGAMNGRIFRLGAAVPASISVTAGSFNLDPAYGMRPIPAGGTHSPDEIPNPTMLTANAANPFIQGYSCAKVYIIGAGRSDPTNASSPPSGQAQDIGAYSTYIQVQ